MLWVILNKFWRQHPTKQLLYGHLPPITKTIQVRRTRHAGHCWRSRDELMMYSCGPPHMDKQRQDDLLEPTYNSSVLENLPEAVDDKEGWRVRVREIHGTTWWWWCPDGLAVPFLILWYIFFRCCFSLSLFSFSSFTFYKTVFCDLCVYIYIYIYIYTYIQKA